MRQIERSPLAGGGGGLFEKRIEGQVGEINSQGHC